MMIDGAYCSTAAQPAQTVLGFVYGPNAQSFPIDNFQKRFSDEPLVIDNQNRNHNASSFLDDIHFVWSYYILLL